MSEEKKEKPVLRPNTIVDIKVPERENDPKVGPPVDVNSDITPITRKPISQVTADKWPDMNAMQLHQQLEILQERFLSAQSCGNIEIANQVNRGILQLQLLIHQKTPDEIKLF